MLKQTVIFYGKFCSDQRVTKTMWQTYVVKVLLNKQLEEPFSCTLYTIYSNRNG